MQILPAIDLKNNKCVRLIQGDFDQQTVYSDNPVEVAKSFAASGAKWLHVVDLDGAYSGERHHTKVIKNIISETDLKVEIGGGIRTIEDVETYISAGSSRVILGTAAHENPKFLQTAVEKFGEKIAVGIDARDGKIAIKGWREQTSTSVLELTKNVAKFGVKTIIYTDIAVDGMLTGPDIKTLKILLENTNLNIIASGGVATLKHIEQLLELLPRQPIGCIIGKAIYTGAINLEEAICLKLEIRN